jgi:hypothetical protein
MNMLIKTQSKFAQLMAIGLISEQGKTQSVNPQRELPQPSEIAMLIEAGVAVTAFFALVAMAALLAYSANPDWISPIRRFHEMI